MKKLFSNKFVWGISLLILLSLIIYLRTFLPDAHYEPGFMERLTDRSQYYVRELLGQNHQMYTVMLDEVKTNFNTFYLIIVSGITVLILISIQIIATITQLPIGYLAYPGKFLVTKKTDKAQLQLTSNEKGESE